MKSFNPYIYILFAFIVISTPFIHHYFIPKYEFIMHDNERLSRVVVFKCNKITGEVSIAY